MSLVYHHVAKSCCSVKFDLCLIWLVYCTVFALGIGVLPFKSRLVPNRVAATFRETHTIFNMTLFRILKIKASLAYTSLIL